MPLPGAASKLSHPKLIPSLMAVGHFPSKVSLQARTETRTGTSLTSTGGLSYTWAPMPGYIDLPCILYDRLPHEDRTVDVIEELKYWTVMLAGFYPSINPGWRARMDDGRIFDIIGVESDSLHISTILTCRVISPVAEPGV